MLIVGWWSSKPGTDSIETLESITLLCYMCYIIPPIISSCPLSPPALPLLRSSPTPCLLSPPPAPSPPIGRVPPITTTSKKPRLPASAPIAHRDPESFASQYIARTCSASLVCRPRSLQITPPPSLLPEVDNPIPPPRASSAASQ